MAKKTYEDSVKRLEDIVATNVGGKYNQGIGEIAYTSKTVVQLSFVKYLKE